MSVTVRPYVAGGWEVDIRVELSDGRVIRERKKAQQSSESSARRWAEARERHLLLHGKPKPVRKEVRGHQHCRSSPRGFSRDTRRPTA